MKAFTVGDKVRVVSKATDDKNFYWNPKMDTTIGKEGTVFIDYASVSGVGTYGVKFADVADNWAYLPESLELVPQGYVLLANARGIMTTRHTDAEAAKQWLRDNNLTGEYQILHVTDGATLRATIDVQAQ